MSPEHEALVNASNTRVAAVLTNHDISSSPILVEKLVEAAVVPYLEHLDVAVFRVLLQNTTASDFREGDDLD